MRNNKKCITCGKEYRYCPTCKGNDYSEAWRNIYCSRNCQEIFNVATGYANNKLSGTDAKCRLEKCDLSYRAKMKPALIARIDEIVAYQFEDAAIEESASDDTSISASETKQGVVETGPTEADISAEGPIGENSEPEFNTKSFYYKKKKNRPYKQYA